MIAHRFSTVALLAALLASACSAGLAQECSTGEGGCSAHGAACDGSSCGGGPCELPTTASAPGRVGKPTLETPTAPTRALVLEDAYRPGSKVDVGSFRGKIAVLRGIVPECGWWNRPGAYSIRLWRKLVAEYGDRVTFVPVRTDFGHRTNKPYGQRLEEAAAFGRKMSLPGPYLVDNDRLDFLRFGTVRYKPRKDPAWGPNGWAYMYVLDRAGRIVYQHGSDPKFHYYQTRLILDRRLDRDFDKAFRAGLPRRTRTLKLKTGAARIYADNFESYRDSYDFKLQPRWGLRCRPADNLEFRGDLAVGAGRGGSKSVDLHSIHSKYMPGGHNIEHALPEPLGSGHIRFFLRRGRAGWDRRGPRHMATITIHGPRRAEAAEITLKGVWLAERFAVAGQRPADGAKLSKKGWHRVEILADPGSAPTIQVDGRRIGRAKPGPVTAIGFNVGHHGYYLDDFEVVYAR